MYLISNIPYFKCWVRKEFTNGHQNYHGEYVHALAVAVTTMPDLDRRIGVYMSYRFLADVDECRWIENGFTKIVKRVKNESQLLNVYHKAKEAGLNASLIKDAGLTELDGENYTAVAIGPNLVEDCEPIVKRLQNL